MSALTTTRGVTRWCGQVLAWLVIVVVLGVLAICVLVPRAGGGTPYTVLTSSMEPDFPPGTLVVVRPVAPEDVAVGDVITFQLVSGRPEVATHRVIAITASPEGTPEFVTQGDANPKPDEAVVVPAQLKGGLWYAVPELGRANLLRRRRPAPRPDGPGRQRAVRLRGGHGRSDRCWTGAGRPWRARSQPGRRPTRGTWRWTHDAAGSWPSLLFALLSVAYAAPAQASDEVLVSNTGSGFAETLAEPLFDPALRWVPGDARSSTFYVKNNTADRAALSLSVLDDDAGELLDSGALHLRVTSPGTSWSPDPHVPGRPADVRGDAGAGPVAAGPRPGRLRPPRVQPHPAAVQRAPDPRAVSGRPDAPASDPAPAPGDRTGRHRPRPGPRPWDLLPDTGLPAGLGWLLLLGSLSLGTGVALVTRRNDDHGESHVH